MFAASTITPLFHDCESPWCFPHLRRSGSGYNAGVNTLRGGHARTISFRKKIAFACVAVLLSLAMALAVSEVAMRVVDFPSQFERPSRSHVLSAAIIATANIGRHVGAAPPIPFAMIGHPFAGYALNPDHPDHDGIYRRTGATAGPNKTRIVCMGGSSTYGTRVAWQDAYPAALQRELGDGYEVRNAGAIAYTTAHIAGLLANEIVHDGADMVLLYVGFNDVAMRAGYDGYRDDYSHALRVYDDRGPLNLYRTRKPQGATTTANIGSSTSDAFARNMQSIVAICRAHDIEPILIYQATAFKAKPDDVDDPSTWASLHAEQMGVVQRIAENVGVRTIDVREMDDNPEYFTDCLHMTAAGNARRAALISDALQHMEPQNGKWGHSTNMGTNGSASACEWWRGH